MPTDACRKGDAHVVAFGLPGGGADAIGIDVERNMQIVLAGTPGTEHIRAHDDAGVPTLRIPVAERAGPRRISIGAGSGRTGIFGRAGPGKGLNSGGGRVPDHGATATYAPGRRHVCRKASPRSCSTVLLDPLQSAEPLPPERFVRATAAWLDGATDQTAAWDAGAVVSTAADAAGEDLLVQILLRLPAGHGLLFGRPGPSDRPSRPRWQKGDHCHRG